MTEKQPDFLARHKHETVKALQEGTANRLLRRFARNEAKACEVAGHIADVTCYGLAYCRRCGQKP